MSISQEDLFKLALNLQPPWYVDSIDFDMEVKQLDIHIDFERGSKFPCPQCGNSGCDVHDTIDRTWRHLNFFQYKTDLHCRVPRTNCETCGVKLVKVQRKRRRQIFWPEDSAVQR